LLEGAPAGNTAGGLLKRRIKHVFNYICMRRVCDSRWHRHGEIK